MHGTCAAVHITSIPYWGTESYFFAESSVHRSMKLILLLKMLITAVSFILKKKESARKARLDRLKTEYRLLSRAVIQLLLNFLVNPYGN